MSARLRNLKEDRYALMALGALVLVGVVLRVLLTRAQAPGFLAFSDSSYYLIGAHTNVFVWAAEEGGNPWPAGYPMFLGALYRVSEQLSFVMLVQHVLGIATAALWFLAVRRVASPFWALLPAAVVLLAGPQLFIEHAPLAESLFAFLIAALTCCAVLAFEQQSALWSAAAGLLAATAACVRVMGLVFVVITVVWLVVVASGDLRQRLTGAAAAALAAGLLLGGYLVMMKHETGFGGPALTRTGNWGTPSQALPGPSYPERVRTDLTRFWSSPNYANLGGYSYDGFVKTLILDDPASLEKMRFEYPYLDQGIRSSSVTQWYDTVTTEASSGLLDTMTGYERHTRVEGIVFLALLLLAVLGVPFARGAQLTVGILLAAIAAATLLTPVLYLYFDARYVIPGYGPLAAVAAVGAAALRERRTVPASTEVRTRGGRAPAKAKA